MTSFLWLFLSLAQAGFLKMTSTSSLQLLPKNNDLMLTGTYSIQNQGDETARSVYPTFQVDRFSWSGEAQNLAAGEQFTWKLNEKISRESLCLKVSQGCPLALPFEGNYLVHIKKNYQDLNGYGFAVPDILELNWKGGIQPPLDLGLHLRALDQKKFLANFSFRNPFSESVQFSVSLHLPQEVELETSTPPLEVPAGKEVQGGIQFQNIKGLPGSEYVAIVAAEWALQGKRSGHWAYRSFRIQKNSSSQKWSLDQTFWTLWTWVFFLGMILLWNFWIRPLRRFSK